jgi:cellulose synthase (UDP-forming)
MFVQRIRWCRGGLQTLFLRSGPFGPGLTAAQRLLFFPLDWLVQTPVRLFAVLVPILFLWTGLTPLLYADVTQLIDYQLPVLVSLTALMAWLSGGRHLPLLSAGFSLLLSFRMVPNIIATLIKPFGVPFKVTPKGSGAGQGVDRFVRGCALGLLGVNLGGLLVNAWPETRRIADPAHMIPAIVFSLLNAVVLLLAVLAGRDRRRLRSQERFLTDYVVACCVEGDLVQAELRDVSATGAGLEWPAGLAVPTALSVTLPEVGPMPAVVVWQRGRRLGVRFEPVDELAREHLLRWVYSIGTGRLQPPFSWYAVGARLAARVLN